MKCRNIKESVASWKFRVLKRNKKRTLRFSIFRAFIEGIMESRQKINIHSLVSALPSRHCFGLKQNKLKKQRKEVVSSQKLRLVEMMKGAVEQNIRGEKEGASCSWFYEISTASDWLKKKTHQRILERSFIKCIYIYTNLHTVQAIWGILVNLHTVISFFFFFLIYKLLFLFPYLFASSTFSLLIPFTVSYS